jgi:glycosyltransferase involved in cell wall biosynthesis
VPGRKTKPTARPFRIGICCDYGVTLLPQEGIGVFIFNLVAGLLQLDEPLEVVLMVHPGDQNRISFPERKNARLEVHPPLERIPAWRKLAEGLARFWVRLWNGLLRQRAAFREGLHHRIASDRQKVQRTFKKIAPRFSRKAAVTLIIATPLFAFGLLFVWMLYTLAVFSIAFIKILYFPFKTWDRLMRKLIESSQSTSTHASQSPSELAAQADCDVWLLPYAGFAHRLSAPTVVVVHDLIHVHFPEVCSAEFGAEMTRRFALRTKEATLVACMSNFIRDHDLSGVLHLSPEKVRVVRHAPPADFPSMNSETASRLTNRPYLFYPAAFRTYKNHAALVKALAVLRDFHAQQEYDLVFTGIKAIPDDLRQLIQDHRFEQKVHVLGCVDRETLAALYLNAFATLVPSLYEQGSFPVYEAIYWQCPVACSRIPSLLEQCEAMGDSMLYFDPRDPRDIVRIILAIRDDREGIRAAQQRTGRLLWKRDWKQAAAEWLAVFKEAALLAGKQSPSQAA